MTADKSLAIDESLAVVWLVLNGVFIFLMQAGFALLEAGTVQPKNVKSILLKNLADICVGAAFFWQFGFGFAYGGSSKILGHEDYFGGDCLDKKYTAEACEGSYGYVDWFFQFTFAVTSSTIVSGAVAERANFMCYLLYSMTVSGLVYPVVVHWVWGGGFLAQGGAHDHAGSAVVHVTGGMAALVGAAVIGPRLGRFKGKRFAVLVERMCNASVTHTGLGVLILWSGWYSFNAGTSPGVVGSESQIGLAMINTTLGGAFGGLSALALSTLLSIRERGFKRYAVEVEKMMNGILAGLVSITAGCDVFSPGIAGLVGLVGGVVYVMAARLLHNLMIDDPLDASPIHYFGGVWGTLAVGLFAREAQALSAGHDDYGVFYGGSGELLLWQIATIVVISVWVGAMSLAVFGSLHYFGLARVSPKAEQEGLDAHYHVGRDRTTGHVANRHAQNVEGFVAQPLDPLLNVQSSSTSKNASVRSLPPTYDASNRSLNELDSGVVVVGPKVVYGSGQASGSVSVGGVGGIVGR